ncbi:hypothetical protein [Mycobacterium sp.]|uniref:hypothetical protein n=1 Tax=Mycobacterium sp. TaxID=1785 RepID=UPI0031CECBC6
MRFDYRPYLIGGVAIAGAAVIVVAPAGPRLPDVQVPAVQPVGSESSDFNVQDLLGGLTVRDGVIIAPDTVTGPTTEVIDPPGGLPDLGRLFDPSTSRPDLGRLDLRGLDLGAMPGPGSLQVPATPDAPAAQ